MIVRSVDQFKEVLRYPIDEAHTNIIGSFLNFFIATNNSDNLFYLDLKNFLISLIDFYIKLYRERRNKDFLSTVLLISIDQVRKCKATRRMLRKYYLPNPQRRELASSSSSRSYMDMRSFLLDCDTSISFLTGELLYKLCDENVKRFVCHVGFEMTAGFLHAKGLLNAEIDEERYEHEPDMLLSSDEEYFQTNNPLESTNGLLSKALPQTPEEEQELTFLMQKISDYNEKVSRSS